MGAQSRQVLAFLAPHRRALAGLLLLLMASTGIALCLPWIAGRLTASLLAGQTQPQSPALLLAIWVLLAALRAALGFATRYGLGHTGHLLTARLRNRLYQHTQALPLAYHHARSRGETLSILQADAALVAGFVTGALVPLVPALLTCATALAIMFWINPPIAAAVALCLPAGALLLKLASRSLRPIARAWVDANGRLYRVTEENLAMLPAIKAFAREPHEQARFQAANRQLTGLSRQQLLGQAALPPLSTLLGTLGLAGVLWIGSTQIQSGQLTAPELVSLLLYAMLLLNPLGILSGIYGQYQTARGATERIVELLGQQSEHPSTGTRLGPVSGELRFEDVWFGYPDREPVLRGLDLAIRTGEIVAITGSNGGGKSTLAHLLVRFADPQSGRVTIDGTDLRGVAPNSVRRQVGLVAQRTLLVNGTIAENIAYGEPAAGVQAIEQAARDAGAHEFISGLPRGYQTIIGDQGVRLSGGQRQRLSLARSLLLKPPVLILDETTAMFDPAGEARFINRCRHLLDGTTVILITHRPASLALADRVLALENGCLRDAPRDRDSESQELIRAL